MTQAKVLLVEDDARLAELVREFLVGHGMDVVIESRGDRAVERVLALAPDVVVLDVMLPGLDGMQVCRQLRPRFTGGVLMLTARGDEADQISGLEVGADDYLPKPVRPRLLLARLSSLLRRLKSRESRVTLGGLEVDLRNRSATMNAESLELTTAEFDLLWLLASRAGEVLTRELIYRELQGTEYDGLDRAIDLRVARLRKKLGDDAKQPRLLKSVRGVGYLLAPDAS